MSEAPDLTLHIPDSVAEAIRLPEARREEALLRELAVTRDMFGLQSVFDSLRKCTTTVFRVSEGLNNLENEQKKPSPYG